MKLDRTEISRLLAKALAYKQAGSDTKATEYGLMLVAALKTAQILPQEVNK